MPEVELRLSEHFEQDELIEGQDVYFECEYRANPAPHRVEWFHEVRFYLILFLEF